MRVITAIKSGDTKGYDEEMTEEEALTYAKLTRRNTEGEGKTVMVIESKPTVQDTLRQKLKNYSYRALIISDPERALQRFRYLDPAEDLPADLLIFSTAGLGFEAVNAFKEFVEFPMARELPCLLLIKKDRQTEFLSQLDLQDHHKVLSLPVKFADIRQQLKELLQINLSDKTAEVED